MSQGLLGSSESILASSAYDLLGQQLTHRFRIHGNLRDLRGAHGDHQVVGKSEQWINDERTVGADGRKRYSVWDACRQAELNANFSKPRLAHICAP